jgi:hypothetical protein
MNKKFVTIIVLCHSFSLFASSAISVGRVAEVSGSGFISQNATTKEVRKGDLIYPNTEVVVEHSGQITIADNFDHRFHLGNSTSISIGEKTIEVRSGDVWIQSANSNDSFQMKTANALVDYQKGEGILTYDSIKGKTQLMVINGIMKLSNSRVPDLNLNVSEGNFSYVDNHYDEGAPRDPTPVGEKTYSSLVSTFKGISPLDTHSKNVFKSEGQVGHSEVHVEKHGKEHGEVKHESTRSIASVDKGEEVKPGKTESHKDIKKENDILEEYKKTLLDKKTSDVRKKVVKKEHKAEYASDSKTPLIIHIFGLSKGSTNTESHYSEPAKAVAGTVNANVNLNTEDKQNISTRAPASLTTPEVVTIEKKDEGPNENKINTNSKTSIENKNFIPSKETDKLLDQMNKL